MAETRDDKLRSLIQLIPPARALREELEKSIHLETFVGTGDFAIKSFQSLRDSTAKITDDPYVEGLSVSPSEKAGDKEKVSLALLAASQLLAYLEGQTGLGGFSDSSRGGGYSINIQKAPVITGLTIKGVSPEVANKAVEAIGKALRKGNDEDDEDEDEK